MSIEVDWATATSGPDGEALAERIRSFVHDKFQEVTLPRFIRSVQCHSFEFGTIGPDLEIKDFCEPFSDFYEEDDDDTSATSEELIEQWSHSDYEDEIQMSHAAHSPHSFSHHPYPGERFQPSALRSPLPLGDHLNPHFLPRAGTPGIPGGTSNLGYHHLMSLGGLSGTQTPLAAVASGWSDSGLDPHSRGTYAPRPSIHQRQQAQSQRPEPDLDTTHSASRPSTANTHPSHPSIGQNTGSSGSNRNSADHPADIPQPSVESVIDDPSIPIPRACANADQTTSKSSVTQNTPEIFVGLPLKLNVTGITFDGVAVIAYIRKRVHFCFLSAEDADALLGSESQASSGQVPGEDGRPKSGAEQKRQGGLLQEIRVESEIGRKEDGKQVLKNVGKVERFVLAQVRRIFEEELVYPSFWTFLI
ncbi:uncharacterized protein N7483_006684 [Penicillium malachiteum]|uniref:uncharacterized protein n=1 Tax=Penicillium malachiteum TaxID=1324776 RepID=UPI00254829E4|nr:uncharacterized protein N7483_006684 [Penicillium malachiteum]KAJ5725327.1 hypothetical protein N7483_006684 [Penicillium malachiteum]